MISTVLDVFGLNKLFYCLRYYFQHFKLSYFNNKVKLQKRDIRQVPIIIISYNQLFYLEQLIRFLKKRDFNNIVIIDNNSSFAPLLEFFKTIENDIKIYRLTQNYGHRVFWEQNHLFTDFIDGYYVVTDPDIVPIKNCPDDFLDYFKRLLDKYPSVNKVGFSLKIDDIPDSNVNKEKILNWENNLFRKYCKSVGCLTKIDTTFALYRPFAIKQVSGNFYTGIRTKTPYQAIHGGWYIDSNNLTKEQLYYIENANESSSWNVDGDGIVKNNMYKSY